MINLLKTLKNQPKLEPVNFKPHFTKITEIIKLLIALFS